MSPFSVRSQPLAQVFLQYTRYVATLKWLTLSLFAYIATLAVVHSGITQIDTAAQAAEALRPIAGAFAFAIFALGIIGTGLLSIPVLAGSAAYALSEAQGWEVGLAKQPLQAKAFYGAIIAATVLGAAANFFELNPAKALVCRR